MEIEQIDDLGTAKQVVLLLEQQNARLVQRLDELTREVATLRGEDGQKQLEMELMKLREQHAVLTQKLFGRSSERRGRDKTDKPKKPHRGHGPRAQPELALVEVVHDFDETGIACEVCGGKTEEWQGQFEESDEITVIDRRFVIHRHKRKKARCGCYAKVVTAPAPAKLIPGCRYSIEFAVSVAVDKYLDHIPLNRQAGIMERDGLIIDSQTLWNQIDALAKHLAPIYNALPGYILHKPVVHADETPWYLLKGKPAKKWYVWCVAVHDAAYYWIRSSRSAAAGGEILADYDGTIVADGYAAYGALARKSKKKTALAFCWSHVRRKYCDAEKFYPDECEHILDRIGDLYDIERRAPDPATLRGEEAERALALRAQLRNEESRPIIADIYEWALAQSAIPGSALRKAVDYMIGLWPGLILFLEAPRIPVDNNLVERQLRGPVVGRKNHYGSRSERGTQVTALLYSLLQTAKLVGVDPKSYLLHATRVAIAKPGTVVMPHALLPKPSTE